MAKQATPTKFVETFDFPAVMYQQIMYILESRHETNPQKFTTDTQGLEFLMRPFWDEEYIKQKKEIDTGKYGTYKNDLEKWNIESKKSGKRFMALMCLISRCGFMPEKKIEGVLDEHVVAAIFETT